MVTSCETVERLHRFGSKVSVAVSRTALRDEKEAVTGILERGRALHEKTEEGASESWLRLLV